MATITTYTRPQPPGATNTSATLAVRDTTPAALGMIASIVVTEDADATGSATVTVSDGAVSWTGPRGVPVDPRTGYPFRRSPWAASPPSDLYALCNTYFIAYLNGYDVTTTAGAWSTTTTTEREEYAVLLSALGALLTEWSWSTDSEEV